MCGGYHSATSHRTPCCSGKPCDQGPLNTEETGDLGKDYWMRRAGEVCCVSLPAFVMSPLV